MTAWACLHHAVAESSAPRRNWRWMLASFGIGAGFGMIAGLSRLGQEPARMTLAVAGTVLQVAVTFFVLAWFAVVAIRLIRLWRA